MNSSMESILCIKSIMSSTAEEREEAHIKDDTESAYAKMFTTDMVTLIYALYYRLEVKGDKINVLTFGQEGCPGFSAFLLQSSQSMLPTLSIRMVLLH